MVQTRRLVILLAVAAAMVSVMPTVEAQWEPVTKHAHVGEANVSSGPIEPETDLRIVHFTLVTRCSGIAPPGADGFHVTNTVSVDHGAAIAFLGKPSYYVSFDSLSCLHGDRHVEQVPVAVRFTADAPAFSSATVHLQSQPETPYANTLGMKVQIMAGFAGDLSVPIKDALVVTDAAGEAILDLPIVNQANGAVRVAAAEAEGDPDVVVSPGGPIIVPSVAQGGETDRGEIPVTIHALPATNQTQVYSVALLVNGVSADDPDVSVDDVHVPLVVVVPGTDGASVQSDQIVEAPAPFLPGLGLLAALGVAALRRRS